MKRAIVVTSGGMDSISMGLSLYLDGYDVCLLHFDYGQKAEPGEARAVLDIAERLGLDAYIINMSGVFGFFRDASSLTDPQQTILPGMDSLIASKEKSGANLWVPGRNLIFLAIAAAYAEYEKADVISWGANQSETSYPDNTMEFANRMAKAVEFGCLHSAEIVAPLYDMDKVEILQWGNSKGYSWIYDYTWSCDEAPDEKGRPCGVCGCCMNRRLAHLLAKIEDRQLYANPSYFRLEFLPSSYERTDLWYGKYL